MRDLARSQRKAISAVREFFGADENHIIAALVLAGRCIDLRMGVPHGDGRFSPLLFVLGVSHLAHKLQQGEWYDNELGAAFFDVDVELLNVYERGICEVLHRHSSLLVGKEQRVACRELLQELGILSRQQQQQQQQQPAAATKVVSREPSGEAGQSVSQLVGPLAANGPLHGSGPQGYGGGGDANQADDDYDDDDEDFEEGEEDEAAEADETGLEMASEVDLDNLLSSWLPTQTVEQAA